MAAPWHCSSEKMPISCPVGREGGKWGAKQSSCSAPASGGLAPALETPVVFLFFKSDPRWYFIYSMGATDKIPGIWRCSPAARLCPSCLLSSARPWLQQVCTCVFTRAHTYIVHLIISFLANDQKSGSSLMLTNVMLFFLFLFICIAAESKKKKKEGKKQEKMLDWERPPSWDMKRTSANRSS